VKDQRLTLDGGGEAQLFSRMESGGGLFLSPVERPLPLGVHAVLTAGGPSLLIRPDSCIAWTDASSTSLEAALARWF
jgi:hypothetical protein